MYVSSGGHEDFLCVQAVGYNVYRCTHSRILYLEQSTTTMNNITTHFVLCILLLYFPFHL